MTLREILHLAFGSSAQYEAPTADATEFAPPPPIPGLGEVNSLRDRAQAGDPAAQRELGSLYYRGRGVLVDRAEAFKWLTLASRQGDAQAEKFLEMVGPTLSADDAYEGRRRISEITGEPLPSRESEAEPMDAFGTRGESGGLTGLAGFPERDSPQDERPGLAPENPVVAAAFAVTDTVPEVGMVPPPPVMLEPMPVGRRGWMLAAVAGVAVLGSAAGIYFFLVQRSETKINAIPMGAQAIAAAEKPLTTADVDKLRAQAEGGDAEAAWRVGDAHEKGVGASKDANLATQWYRRAAEAGSSEGQFRFGLMCEQGQGVPQDYSQAAEWYRKAAERGAMGAQNNLGVLYIKGLGVKADYVEAYKWLYLASSRGFRGSVRNRDMLATFMSAEQIAEAVKQANAQFERFSAGP